jgi:uncharacterized protein with ATP-grasp and redox domains
MEEKKTEQKITINIQQTKLFHEMCAIMNEMFNDKRVPAIYKTRISQLIKRSIK